MERFMTQDFYNDLADLFNAELELKQMVAELNSRFNFMEIKVREGDTLTMEGIDSAKSAVARLLAKLDADDA
jgi:hypothetical protein